MKTQILLAIGVAGMLGAQPASDAIADVRIGINIPGGPGIFFESRPDFIYLDDYGFSVSYGGPYDVVYFDNAYFIFRDGYWYRAWDYRGPWGRIDYYELPMPIRRHGWDKIRRYRDIEYRRHDRRYWDDRFRRDRDRWGGAEERRGPDDRRGFDDRRGPGVPPPPPPPQPREQREPSRPQFMREMFGQPPAGPRRQSEPPAPAPSGPPAPGVPPAPAPQRPENQQKGPDRRDGRDRRDDRDDRDGRPGPDGRQQEQERFRQDRR